MLYILHKNVALFSFWNKVFFILIFFFKCSSYILNYLIKNKTYEIQSLNKPFTGCTFKCNTKTAMKIHLKKHTGQKSVACPTCGALFATNTKYMDHCIRKTPAKSKYIYL